MIIYVHIYYNHFSPKTYILIVLSVAPTTMPLKFSKRMPTSITSLLNQHCSYITDYLHTYVPSYLQFEKCLPLGKVNKDVFRVFAKNLKCKFCTVLQPTSPPTLVCSHLLNNLRKQALLVDFLQLLNAKILSTIMANSMYLHLYVCVYITALYVCIRALIEQVLNVAILAYALIFTEDIVFLVDTLFKQFVIAKCSCMHIDIN